MCLLWISRDVFLIISGKLIPGLPAAFAHVDSVEKEGERGGAEAEFPAGYIDSLRPGEIAFFQTFRQYPQATPVPVKDFKEAAAFVGEGEECPAVGIFTEFSCDGLVKSVKGFAHVARLYAEEDTDAAGET